MIKTFKFLCLSAAISLPLTSLAANELQSENEKLSYAMGYSTGQALRMHHVHIHVGIYNEALEAGLTDQKARLNKQEMGQVLQSFQEQQVKKIDAERGKLAASNLKAGKQYQQKFKQQKDVKMLKSGLLYREIDPGKGVSPQLADTVKADYEGKLIDGTVFDSSYQRHEPMSFPVSGVIKGWQEALSNMTPGATWEVVIPAELAYGEEGVSGTDIGPNETLIFKIHLISVTR